MRKFMTTKEKTESFFQTVQAGDIALFQPFDESIAIFGYTKVGKTSSCHIMVNSPLKAEFLNGDLIYKAVTMKYNTAIIGNTTESETEIPNIFQGKFRDSKGVTKTVTLLDQPGYGDTYGFHRIFSNGYFHYRTFSKTPKLKFILAIKKSDLSGTGYQFKKTISNFIQTFADYEKIKKDILNATAFLITQVEPKSKIDEILESIERVKTATSSMTEKETAQYHEIIDHMLANKKMFSIEKPEHANNQTRESDLLRQIYEKTTFWVRPLKGKIVEMQEINFSVAEEILQSLGSFKGKTLFKEDFFFFMDYMNKRIKTIFTQHKFSLFGLIETLKKDATESIESHNFLQGMADFNRDFYQFNEAYRERREKTQSNLFGSNEPQEQEQKIGFINNQSAMYQRKQHEKQMKAVYFIKKFNVLEYIKKKAAVFSLQFMDFGRQITELETVSAFFIDIFKKFNLLRIQRSDSEKIIYKYSYVVQRLIEESKIITLILFSNDECKRKFDEIKMAMVDIFRPLRDVILESQFQQFQVSSLKEQFLHNLDFDSLHVVNKEIIAFLESTPDYQGKFVHQVAKQILKYAQLASDRKKKMNDNERRYIASKLFEFRSKFYNHFKTVRGSQAQTCIETIFKLTNALGNLLLCLGHYYQARQTYKSINNASFVLKIFEVELKAKENEGPNKTRLLYIDYGNFASYCHRKQLAMTNYQQAYARSETYFELEEVSNLIVKLETKETKNDPYLSRFNEKKFCESLDHIETNIAVLVEDSIMLE